MPSGVSAASAEGVGGAVAAAGVTCCFGSTAPVSKGTEKLQHYEGDSNMTNVAGLVFIVEISR